MISSLRCLCFSKRIIAWCPCTPEPKRFNSIWKSFSAVSRWYCFLVTTPFRVVPSKLLMNALYCYICQVFLLKMPLHEFYPGIYTTVGFILITPRFLNILLDISLRSLVLDNFVRNVSRDLFRGSNSVTIAVASILNPV